jgi:hypothetical protein
MSRYSFLVYPIAWGMSTRLSGITFQVSFPDGKVDRTDEATSRRLSD